jgi:hypothetical protein
VSSWNFFQSAVYFAILVLVCQGSSITMDLISSSCAVEVSIALAIPLLMTDEENSPE